MSSSGLSVGIIGLPNAGKSTLFNALIKRQLAKVAEYPFTTIDPYEGVVDVPDERLITLSSMIKPDKTTPATVTIIDIAGLVKGAAQGEGLGNEFLGHIREVDAIVHVVRAFESSEAAHVLISIDPQRDIEIVNTELVLKDLDIVSKLVEKEKDLEKKRVLATVKDSLNKNVSVNNLKLNEEERKILNDLKLLSNKPMFYVLNISESQLGSPKIKTLEEKDFLFLCAKLEVDLEELPPDEQKEYLKSVGVTSSSLEKVIKEAYSILNLITFFTIKGGKEVRAWPIKLGTTALDASAVVHTDMARGFIKAEVINCVDFVSIGNWHLAHEQGKIRLEGRDYQLVDGDIIEFKFRN